jgi:hypothetical protein
MSSFARTRAFSLPLLATAALLMGAVGVLVDATPSSASIVAIGGSVLPTNPPPVVSESTLQNNEAINLFTEQTDVTPQTSVPVDITPSANPLPFTYTVSNLTQSSIPAGTPVDSYFMYSNPVGQPNLLYPYHATLTFSTPILGIDVLSQTLNQTDGTLGAPGTNYIIGPADGLENNAATPGNPDTVEIDTPTRISVDFHTENDIDSIRIITAASPSTSSGTTGGGGVGSGPDSQGYTEVASDGGLFTFGSPFYGSMGGQPLNKPMVGGAQVTGAPGYWTVASDGGVFSFGDAGFYGSTGAIHLNAPIVGMASTPDGLGYWLVASDGGIFAFGDAGYYGSRGGRKLNQPIVGMAATPDGKGYWLVAADGGIFSYGDAVFFGSTGAITLNKPIVGMTVTPDGAGYWLLASDGGIFSYGDATFFGSMGGQPLNQPMVAMKVTADGGGYWTMASDGGVFSFGDASFLGSMGGTRLNKPVVGSF